jgi:WD40 repeat protein
MRGVVLIGLCAACSFERGYGAGGEPPDGDVDVKPTDDAMVDAPPFATGPFKNVMKVSVSSSAREDDVTLTGDMLEMYFESDRETSGQSDIYVSRRATINDTWSLPAKVSELSTSYHEGSMDISADGLTMYFASNRPPSTSMDVLVTKRADRSSPWSAPEVVASLSGSENDYDAQPWTDTVLYLGSARGPAMGGSDVFRSTRASAAGAWGTPMPVPGLSTSMYEGEAFADATGAIWFTGNGAGDDDIYRAEPNGDGTFKTPQVVMEICGPNVENDPWLSPDGHTIYFTSDRNGSSLDIYMATR